MFFRRILGGITLALGLNTAVPAAMYTINNPADKIRNPADSMKNPATQIKNPATDIYNPATQMNNENPLTPPSKPDPQTASGTSLPPKPTLQQRPILAAKYYTFKSVKEYVTAAKQAFARDDFAEFIAISEDALRRINASNLRASKKTRLKLITYTDFGYALMTSSQAP
jgi:hypothetical protein